MGQNNIPVSSASKSSAPVSSAKETPKEKPNVTIVRGEKGDVTVYDNTTGKPIVEQSASSGGFTQRGQTSSGEQIAVDQQGRVYTETNKQTPKEQISSAPTQIYKNVPIQELATQEQKYKQEALKAGFNEKDIEQSIRTNTRLLPSQSSLVQKEVSRLSGIGIPQDVVSNVVTEAVTPRSVVFQRQPTKPINAVQASISQQLGFGSSDIPQEAINQPQTQKSSAQAQKEYLQFMEQQNKDFVQTVYGAVASPVKGLYSLAQRKAEFEYNLIKGEKLFYEPYTRPITSDEINALITAGTIGVGSTSKIAATVVGAGFTGYMGASAVASISQGEYGKGTAELLFAGLAGYGTATEVPAALGELKRIKTNVKSFVTPQTTQSGPAITVAGPRSLFNTYADFLRENKGGLSNVEVAQLLQESQLRVTAIPYETKVLGVTIRYTTLIPSAEIKTTSASFDTFAKLQEQSPAFRGRTTTTQAGIINFEIPRAIIGRDIATIGEPILKYPKTSFAGSIPESIGIPKSVRDLMRIDQPTSFASFRTYTEGTGEFIQNPLRPLQATMNIAETQRASIVVRGLETPVGTPRQFLRQTKVTLPKPLRGPEDYITASQETISPRFAREEFLQDFAPDFTIGRFEEFARNVRLPAQKTAIESVSFEIPREIKPNPKITAQYTLQTVEQRGLLEQGERMLKPKEMTQQDFETIYGLSYEYASGKYKTKYSPDIQTFDVTKQLRTNYDVKAIPEALARYYQELKFPRQRIGYQYTDPSYIRDIIQRPSPLRLEYKPTFAEPLRVKSINEQMGISQETIRAEKLAQQGQPQQNIFDEFIQADKATQQADVIKIQRQMQDDVIGLSQASTGSSDAAFLQAQEQFFTARRNVAVTEPTGQVRPSFNLRTSGEQIIRPQQVIKAKQFPSVRQQIRSALETLNIPRIAQQNALTQLPDQRQIQQPQLSQVQQQRLQQSQLNQLNQLTQLPELFVPPATTPTIPILDIPAIEESLMPLPSLTIKKPTPKKSEGGYNVLVKDKNKKFVKANKRPQSYMDALRLGEEVVDNSAARSFKIVQTSKAPQMSETNYDYNPDLIRPAKSNSNIFVEKSAYAINTIGEIRGISAKGWLAQRRKSMNFFGF